MINYGFCNNCKRKVPVKRVERDGKVYLEKNCKDCGLTSNIISSNARQYFRKRNSDIDYKPRIECKINCTSCLHKVPAILFLDLTNRCNMNCPICISNTPAMKFVYDPPFEYFEKILRHFAKVYPPPSIELYGGEPTMRKDLFKIINLAKELHMSTRLITNGLKLADQEYCKKLLE